MEFWLESRLDLLLRLPSPLIVAGGEEWGATLLIEELANRVPSALITLAPRDRDDVVAQGNALATALNRLTHSRLYSQGFPAQYHLEILQQVHSSEPMILILNEGQHGPDLVLQLLAVQTPGIRVIVAVDGPLIEANAEQLGPLDLALTADEAITLAGRLLSPSSARALRNRSGGRYPKFIKDLHSGIDRPTNDYSTRHPKPKKEPVPVPPPLLIAALRKKGRLVDALEVAVMSAPELVEDLLDAAGPAYQQRGLLRRLHLLLSSLDAPWGDSGRALEWRLVAGAAENDLRELLPLIDSHLERHEAPDLRARRAALLHNPQGISEAQRALECERTSLTVWQSGRMIEDNEVAITLLRESITLAELSGDSYSVARNAGALAERYAHAGRFHDAVHWSQWALHTLERNDIDDGFRRLRLLSNWAFARIISGDVTGLRRLLLDISSALKQASSAQVDIVRSTLASLELAHGNLEAAKQILDAPSQETIRINQTRRASRRVRVLLETGDVEEAEFIAAAAIALTSGESDLLRQPARLAHAMVLAFADDPAALPDLVSVLEDSRVPMEDRLTAYLYSQLLADHPEAPADVTEVLATLTSVALQVLSGPEKRFRSVWRRILGDPAPLELAVLGEPRARLDNEALLLTRRLWEVLTALTLHEQGLTDEQLHDFLVGDSGAFGLSALRTHVSRLRSLVPISDNPYRLQISFTLDVLQAREKLREGDVRSALMLCRGPLLPASDSPGIRGLREDLQEELRQGVLQSDDPEALFELAEREDEDLELWEAAAAVLPLSDTRRALALARVRRLSLVY